MSDRPLATRLAEIAGIAGFGVALAALYVQVRANDPHPVDSAAVDSAERGAIAQVLFDLGQFHRDVQAWGAGRDLSLMVAWAVVITIVVLASSILLSLGAGAMSAVGNTAGLDRFSRQLVWLACWTYVAALVYLWVFARALSGWAVAAVFMTPLVLLLVGGRIGNLASRRIFRNWPP